MLNYTLTASPTESNTGAVFCPSVLGLTPAQADLAFLMPRMNHNQCVRDTPRRSDWAALLASDPFGSESALFAHLLSVGYRGVTNWPSSILLDEPMTQAMSTIPASPEFEYAYLARAGDAGLNNMAFFRSLRQAEQATAAGLDTLILHPGIIETLGPESSQALQRSLERLIEAVRRGAPSVSILAYTSPWHERHLALNTLPVEGIVQCEVRP